MIVVTGGLGMIGAHTAQALLELDEEVVVTRHHSADVPSFLADRVTVEQLDVADRDAFLDLGNRHDITGIVHLAAPRPAFAPSPTGHSVADTVEFLRLNTTGLFNALEVANHEFAAALEAAVPGAKVALEPGGRLDPYLDITRLTADSGFTPRFDATTAVADFVGWLATNPR